MGIYSDLDDGELAAEIVDLRTRLKNAAGGGTIKRMAAEGRSKEVFGGDIRQIRQLLNTAIAERDRRAGKQADGPIGVVFP